MYGIMGIVSSEVTTPPTASDDENALTSVYDLSAKDEFSWGKNQHIIKKKMQNDIKDVGITIFFFNKSYLDWEK